MKLSLNLNNLFIKKFGVGTKDLGGFTLLEIIVSVSIIGAISGLILASYPKFTETAKLHQGTQSLVSNIRRAQVYGISVKENPIGAWAFPAYGIHFDFNDPGLLREAYVLFADINENTSYDAGELVSRNVVPSPGYLFQICSNLKTGSSPSCSSTCVLSSLNVIFKRPVPDIYLYGEPGPVGPCEDVEIVLESPRGAQKTVVIWRTGQIAVE